MLGGHMYIYVYIYICICIYILGIFQQFGMETKTYRYLTPTMGLDMQGMLQVGPRMCSLKSSTRMCSPKTSTGYAGNASGWT